MREDILAHLARDPAARTELSVALTAPGLHAIWIHRGAHRLWNAGHLTLAELVTYGNRFLTGVEIHPAACIGRRVVIDHGMGVVIGETAVVGDDCMLYAGVVLGGRSVARTRRHPELGKGVVVGTNSSILGRIKIGDGAKVGAGAIVVRDVPARETVVGGPDADALRARVDHALREVERLATEQRNLSNFLKEHAIAFAPGARFAPERLATKDELETRGHE